MKSFSSNIPNLMMMVRPKSFGFNHQTAESNSFQNQSVSENVNELAQQEFDQMVAKIAANNIELKVFDDIEPGLPDSVFPNNWISHIPNRAIVIYPMLTENRKKEVRSDIINWVKSQLRLEEQIDLRDSSLILEGTGSIVFDHLNKIAFAAISPRTSITLLNQLCQKIGYRSVSFESVDLKGGQIYHTNVMMSVGERFAIVCLESVPDIIERTMLKKELEEVGKEIIEISYAQMNAFAGNALEVCSTQAASYFLMSKTAENCLSENQKSAIEQYAKILSFDISTIEKVGGGSVRCMLAGFFNYPK